MNVGDLVKIRGSRGWATHRVVEGSRQCPLYVKRLDDGVLSPLEFEPSQESPYVVVESRERIAERLILGHDRHIPVLEYIIGKKTTATILDLVSVSVEYGEGVFNLIMPGTDQYQLVNGVFIDEKENFQFTFPGGWNLTLGDSIKLVSFGAKPKTQVVFHCAARTEKTSEAWTGKCTLD